MGAAAGAGVRVLFNFLLAMTAVEVKQLRRKTPPGCQRASSPQAPSCTQLPPFLPFHYTPICMWVLTHTGFLSPGPRSCGRQLWGRKMLWRGPFLWAKQNKGEATGFRGCPLHHPLGGMVGPVEWGSTFFGAGIEVGGI